MLKMKIIFMYCAVASSSCVLGGESNTSLVVPSNQTAVFVGDGGHTVSPVVAAVPYGWRGLRLQKKIRKSALAGSRKDFLNQEAEKLICLRKDRTNIISDQIDAQYVGVGDNWSLKRYMEVYLEISTPSPHHFFGEYEVKNAVRDLVAIHSLIGTRLDKQLIDELRFANTRFDNLLKILIVQSKSDVFGNAGISGCNIKGSTIDGSFDMGKQYPDLPVDLQQYIYFKLEQTYRNVFNLKECVKFVPHLLYQALLGSQCSKQELEALLKSSVLKQYSRKNRKLAVAFKQAIRGSFVNASIDKPGQLVEFGIEKSAQDALVAMKEDYRCADGTEYESNPLQVFLMLALLGAFLI